MKQTFILLFLFGAYVSWGKVFLVNTGGDQPNVSIGNCACLTASGGCSFVAAIQASQNCPGVDTIILLLNVSLGTSPFFGGMIISETVLIEGNNHFIDLTNVDTTNGRNRIFIVVTATDVTVRDLRVIQSPFTAFFALADHFTFENGGIVGRGIDFGAAGIELRQSDSSRIENSFFGENGLAVRFIQSHYGQYIGCIAIGNQHSNGTFYDSHHGIFRDNYLKGSDHYNAFNIFGAHHNTFKNNVFDGAILGGLTTGLQSEVDSLNVRVNVIDSNLFINNGGNAITFGTFVDSMTITNNDMFNNGSGIAGGTTTGNKISRNRIRNLIGSAITFTDFTNSAIDSNDFDGNGGDVINLRSSSVISITGNRIGMNESNAGSGVTFAACRNLVMHGNSIKKGSYGIRNTDLYEGTRSSQIEISNTVIDSTIFDAVKLEVIDTLLVSDVKTQRSGGHGFSFSSISYGSFLRDTAFQNQSNGFTNTDEYESTRSNQISFKEILSESNFGRGSSFSHVDTLLIENSAFLFNTKTGNYTRNSRYVSIKGSTFSWNGEEGQVTENCSTVFIGGSFFGIDSTGMYPAFNGGEAFVLSDTLQNVVVGGSRGARNYFASDSNTASISVYGITGSTIALRDNFAGLNINGEVVGSRTAVRLEGDLYQVTLDSLVASGAYEAGILVRGDGLRITNTKVGTDTSGFPVSGYGNEYGILIVGSSSDNQIGSTDTSKRCIIAGNILFGVGIIGDSFSGFPYRNSVITNSIFDNGGNGIDIVDLTDSVVLGPNENDTIDSDDGPNGALNYPCIQVVNPGYVVYNFDGPIGKFRIDFFRNSVLSTTGYGEGEEWLGYDTVSITNSPVIGRVLNISSIMSGDIITATATECLTNDCTTFGSTSEFSNAFQMIEGGGLPVKLLWMTVKELENCHTQVCWETATEKDNLGFVILRDNGALDFDSVGWVPGTGNSSMNQVYCFEDTGTVDEAISYYRLKQIDFNGKSEFHPIVPVRRECERQEVGPCDILQEVELCDMAGKFLGTVKISEFEAYARERKLSPGWYVLCHRLKLWVGE